MRSLLRNLRFILKIGASTGPRTFSLIELFKIFFNSKASLSNIFSFSEDKINEINLS